MNINAIYRLNINYNEDIMYENDTVLYRISSMQTHRELLRRYLTWSVHLYQTIHQIPESVIGPTHQGLRDGEDMALGSQTKM